MLETLCMVAGVVVFSVVASLILSRFLDKRKARATAKRNEQALADLREYQFPAIVREVFRRENPGVSAQQEELAFRGLRDYFMLLLLEQQAERYGSLGMPSTLVDEAWHAFVLCTEPYALFCRQIFGRPVHHFPNPKAQARELDAGTQFSPDVMETWNAYDRGRTRYPGYFGDIDDVPLLFALDAYSGHPGGWLWTAPALESLQRQSEHAAAAASAAPTSDSSGGPDGTGSGWSFWGSGGSNDSNAGSDGGGTAADSDNGHATHGGGASCGSNCTAGADSGGGSGGGSNCGSSCSSASGSSCGSSCGSGGGSD